MGSDLSYAAIARKYGVSPRQVAEHGRREGWPEKRQDYRNKIATRARQKAVYKKSERIAEKMAAIDEAAGLLLEQLVEGLTEDADALHRHRGGRGEKRLQMLNGDNAQALARTLETLAAVIRDANDKPSKAEATKIREMQQRMRLEKLAAEAESRAQTVEVQIHGATDAEAEGMAE